MIRKKNINGAWTGWNQLEYDRTSGDGQVRFYSGEFLIICTGKDSLLFRAKAVFSDRETEYSDTAEVRTEPDQTR